MSYIALPDGTLIDLSTAQKWEWSQIVNGVTHLEELYYHDDGIENGIWALRISNIPETPIAGVRPSVLWYRFTHPQRAARWFLEHGLTIPPELVL